MFELLLKNTSLIFLKILFNFSANPYVFHQSARFTYLKPILMIMKKRKR